jgi:hypothetical protein
MEAIPKPFFPCLINQSRQKIANDKAWEALRKIVERIKAYFREDDRERISNETASFFQLEKTSSPLTVQDIEIIKQKILNTTMELKHRDSLNPFAKSSQIPLPTNSSHINQSRILFSRNPQPCSTTRQTKQRAPVEENTAHPLITGWIDGLPKGTILEDPQTLPQILKIKEPRKMVLQRRVEIPPLSPNQPAPFSSD